MPAKRHETHARPKDKNARSRLTDHVLSFLVPRAIRPRAHDPRHSKHAKLHERHNRSSSLYNAEWETLGENASLPKNLSLVAIAGPHGVG